MWRQVPPLFVASLFCFGSIYLTTPCPKIYLYPPTPLVHDHSFLKATSLKSTSAIDFPVLLSARVLPFIYFFQIPTYKL